MSSTGTTVSAPAGIIAPVMIRSAVPGPTSSIRRPTRRHLAQDPEHHRPIDGRPGHVRSPDREAVHGAVRPGRQGQGGADGVGERHARGIGEVDAHGWQGLDAVEHPAPSLVERDQIGQVGHGSAPCGGAGHRADAARSVRIRRSRGRPGNPVEWSPTRGRCPSNQRDRSASCLRFRPWLRHGPANVRRSPSRWPVHAQHDGPFRAPGPQPRMRRSPCFTRAGSPDRFGARPPFGGLDDHRPWCWRCRAWRTRT